ncbi:murein biosynthesis integral membrane protein MurJ [Candidatus Gottesmanbacteria bacterium]|nr:murein biosynthesis integral membrane protein MurJ [Candidatus Gottesmanbacteria bacterium]
MKRALWQMFTRRQTSIGSAALVLASMVLASRFLGLIRDRLLAARFSADELGIYFAAFRLPNLLFELLVMGALTTAFIPVFTRYLTQEKEGEAWRMAAIIINTSLLLLAIIAVPLFVWAPQASRLFAPGFTPQQIVQMARFTRFILMLQVAPLLVGNFFTGILQSYRSFIVPAVAPVIYNIGIIIGIVAFTGWLGLMAPVVGVGIGALLFMLIQIPVLRSLGYRHQFIVTLRQQGVRDVLRLLGPRTLGLAASQIDTTVDLMLATLLGARMVTIFNFAQHLQQLPVGLFGATIAQAALPTLSLSAANNDRGELKQAIVTSLHQMLFFIFPVSVLFVVLRTPIVRLVFGASRFDWEATVLTGMTLSMFSLSLAAQALVHLFARGFYALYDSKTPVAIAVGSILLNAALSIVLIMRLGLPVWSLGLSTSVASIIHACVLFYYLDRRLERFSRAELLLPLVKMGFAAMIAGVAIYIPLKILDQLVFDTTRTFGLILLTGMTGTIGLTVYFFLSWVMGVGEVHSFISMIRRVRRVPAVILEPAREVINGGTQDKVQ